MKIRQIDLSILWSTVARYGGRILMAGISVVTAKMLINFLGDDLYSDYRKIIEYMTFFYVAANLGLEANIIRHMADNPEDGKIFTNALVLRMVTAAGILGVAVLIVPFFGDGVFWLGALVYGGFFFFEFVTTVCKAMLQAHYLMGRAMAAVVGGKVLYAGLVWWLTSEAVVGGAGAAELGEAFRGAFSVAANGDAVIPLLYLAPFFGGLVTMLACMILVRRKLKFEWKMDFGLWKELLWTGLPFGIVNVLNGIYMRSAPHFLVDGVLEEAGMEGVFGSFNLQFRIAFMLSLFSTALMLSVMPALKHSLTIGNKGRARELLKKSSWILFGVGAVLVGGVSWLGPILIEVVANRTLVVPELWFVFPMFLGLAAISYFYDLVLISLYTLDQEWWFLKREIVALFVAGLVFGLSYLVGPADVKVAIVIGGAICGELFMVIIGMRKLRQLLKVD